MFERRFRRALKFRNDALRENLAELDAPLIERIDVPDRTLREHRVLIERDQLAECFGHDGIGWTIALEHAVRNQPVRSAFRRDLLASLAKCQRFGLRVYVGDEHVVMSAERMERLRKSDEIARDKPGPLVNELVEGMLPVGSRL